MWNRVAPPGCRVGAAVGAAVVVALRFPLASHTSRFRRDAVGPGLAGVERAPRRDDRTKRLT